MRAKVYEVGINSVIFLEEEGDEFLQLPNSLCTFEPVKGLACNIIFDDQDNVVRIEELKTIESKITEDIKKIETDVKDEVANIIESLKN